jgi:Glycosyl hydrolase catalytic core/Carbohydrate binding module (family 6)
MMGDAGWHGRGYWLGAVAMAAAGMVGMVRAAEPGKAPAIRIVNCDEQVQSHKRGVGANHLEPEDFKVLAPGVSWWYDWGNHLGDTKAPAEVLNVEFVPMVWGDRAEDLAGLERYLAAGNKPRHILAINEPNLREQCFIAPAEAAALYTRVKGVADKHGIAVVGPQMAIGSAPADSITAIDPVGNKQVTYTFVVPYLKAMLFYTDKAGTEVGAVGIHPYGGLDELRGLVELAHRTFGRPVWVTEYNRSGAKSDQEQREFLIRATDFLERSPYVQGYAWFKERIPNVVSNIALLKDKPGELTALGEAYVQLPVHEADLYYRLPGRLQAERYVTLEKADTWPTWDVDGLAHMASDAAGAWLDYNVQVDQAGSYTMRLRLTGKAGAIEILSGEKALGTVSLEETPTAWTTLSTTVTLEQGPQTIRLRCQSQGQGINWIEFTRP